MDYLLSREFDAQFPAMETVARSVVIVVIKLILQMLARDATLSFQLSMDCTIKLLNENRPHGRFFGGRVLFT